MSTLTAEIYIDNEPPVRGDLTIEVEQIDITMSTKTEPDMSWEYVDGAGHFHAWSTDTSSKDIALPTLNERAEHVGCSCDNCNGEGYYITVYTCAICGETIEPETVSYSPLYREYMPGRKSWQVEVDDAIERDKRVTVRVVAGDTTYFGMAASRGVVRTVMDSFMDRPANRSLLLGLGPLGQRKTSP